MTACARTFVLPLSTLLKNRKGNWYGLKGLPWRCGGTSAIVPGCKPLFHQLAAGVHPRLLTGLCYGAMMSLAIGVNLLLLMPWAVEWVGDLVNLRWGLAVSGLAPLLMLLLVLLLQRQSAGQGSIAPEAMAQDFR